jgi:hypothetical protein
MKMKTLIKLFKQSWIKPLFAYYPLSYFPQGGKGGFTPSPLGEGREGGYEINFVNKN